MEIINEGQTYYINIYIPTAEKKLSLFFNNISFQMGKLRNPMSSKEKERYELAFCKIKIVQKNLHLLEVELLAYRAGSFPVEDGTGIAGEVVERRNSF